MLQTLTEDVVKSSEIEGEKLDASQVRSSIARRLGMDVGGVQAADRHVEGVVEMMLDATRRYDQPLSEERLFAWHASPFPTGRSGMRKIRVGAWRDDSAGPMQRAMCTQRFVAFGLNGSGERRLEGLGNRARGLLSEAVRCTAPRRARARCMRTLLPARAIALRRVKRGEPVRRHDSSQSV